MTIDELAQPIDTTIVSTTSDKTDASTKQKVLKSIIDQNSVVVSEMMNSTYNTSMEIIKNIAPSEEEMKLREQGKKEVWKQENEKREKTEEELEEKIMKEELDDELTSKMESLV